MRAASRILCVLVLLVAACGDDTAGEGVTTSAPAVVETTSAVTVTSSTTTTEPPPAEYGEPILWLAGTDDADRGHMAEIDTATGEVLVEVDLGSRPGTMVLGAGGLWVSDCWSDQVFRIDPESGEVLATIAVPGCPDDMIVHDGLVWVAAMGEPAVHRIDPITDQILDSMEVSSSPTGIADGSVWVVLSEGLLLGLDDDLKTTSQISFPGGGEEVAVGAGSVFALNSSNTAIRFDPEGPEMGEYYWRTDEEPTDYSLAYCRGQLWSFSTSQLGYANVPELPDPGVTQVFTGVDLGEPVTTLSCFGNQTIATTGSGRTMIVGPDGEVSEVPVRFSWVPVGSVPVARTPQQGGNTPIVCDFLYDEVPGYQIDNAVAHPQRILGWGTPTDWDRPVGPDNPPSRTLTLADPSEPWDPVINPLVYAPTCAGRLPSVDTVGG